MKVFEGHTKLNLTVNGEVRTVYVEPADTLLWTLRRGLGLTGTKLGCENGDCGACTVQADGVPIKSCYTFTVDVADRRITTIEGLQDTPVQDGFQEEYGFQCGYCTSGFIMNGEALLRSFPEHDPLVDVDWLQSNICRCTGYEGIRNAIARARENGPGSGSDS